MWLDILSPYNTIPINIKLANLLGLEAAAYWSELMNVYARVINKKKDEMLENDGFFTLDRDYIQKRTTVSVERQLEIDAALNRLGILFYKENDSTQIALDVQTFCAKLVDDDVEAIRQLQKTAKLNRDDKANAKKNSVAINLKAVLTETNVEVLAAYKTWIDAMLEAKKPLTKAAVEIYQKNLDNYTDNKDVKIKILEIATTLAYHEFAWARDQYEKNYKGNGTFIGVKQKQGNGIDPNSKF